MRTIAHLSDLHFGAADHRLVAAVTETIRALAPDVVAVSGDLTQRARRRQFLAARRFLDELGFPCVVVPGNHDVPLYNVFARFAAPRAGFRRHIAADRYPSIHDDEVLVIGADTTRSFTIKDGGLRPADLAHLLGALAAAPPRAVKVVVCHHPFDRSGLGGHWTRPAAVRDAVKRLVEAGTDILLTGHLHVSGAGHTAERYATSDRSAIVVEAGTATSVRGRGEPNAFNVLRVEAESVSVERLAWDGAVNRFVPSHRESFVRSTSGWMPMAHGWRARG